jgi:hypothetical protein
VTEADRTLERLAILMSPVTAVRLLQEAEYFGVDSLVAPIALGRMLQSGEMSVDDAGRLVYWSKGDP